MEFNVDGTGRPLRPRTRPVHLGTSAGGADPVRKERAREMPGLPHTFVCNVMDVRVRYGLIASACPWVGNLRGELSAFPEIFVETLTLHRRWRCIWGTGVFGPPGGRALHPS